MAPLTVLTLTLACAATAIGQDSVSECAANSDGTCQSQLEDSMRVELLQERYSMGGSAIATAPAQKAAAPAAATKADANLNRTQALPKAANVSSHGAMAVSNVSRAVSNGSINGSMNASSEPFPDLGGIISGVADAISGGGSIGDIVESVAGGATEALLTPITDAINNTLTNINDQIVDFAADVNQHTTQLTETASSSYDEFLISLNETLELAMSRFSVIPFSQISDALDSVGAAGILPPEITSALATISSVVDQLGNATLVAQGMMNVQNRAYSQVAQGLAQLNDTLYMGLATVQTGTGMLVTGYQELSSTIVTRLQTLPGLSLLPDAIMETVQTVFASAATTVNTIAGEINGALQTLVSGIERASLSALSMLPEESNAPKLALGVAPILAAALALA